MALGTFGSSAPRLKTEEMGGSGSSPVSDALDASRELQGPTPEGQPAIREQIQPLAVSGQGGAAADATTTTTSTSKVDLDTMTTTVTIVGSNTGVLLLFNSFCSNNTAEQTVQIQLFRDGTAIGFTARNAQQGVAVTEVDQDFPISIHHFEALETSGAHTYKVQWSVSNNTGSMFNRRLDAIEMRR